jgi:hypothetical protein
LSSGQTYTSAAYSINSADSIVGYTQTATYTHSEEWGSQGSRSLFGSNNTISYGINDNGWVVGSQTYASGQSAGSGFVWAGGSPGNVTSGFPNYLPVVINNSNMTVGQESGNGTYWSPTGNFGAIGTLLPSEPSSLYGLNDNDIMVGASGSKGVIYDPSIGQLYDINTYLPTNSPFTQLTTANDINNNNEFIGEGLVNGVEHGFVGQISSVPEPSAIVLLGIGAVSFLAYGWRRRTKAS